MAKKHERDHLYQKPGESMWYVRLVIPVDVRPSFGNRRTLTKTTGTTSKAEALIARHSILALWKQQIQEARQGKIENADAWRQLMHDSGSDLKNKRIDVATRLYNLSPPANRSESDADLSWIHAIPEIYADLIEDGQSKLADRLQMWANSYLASMERGFDHAAGIASQNELLSITAEINAAATAEEYELTEEEAIEARDIILNPSRYKPRSPISKSMLDEWSTHLEKQIPTPKTRDTHRARMQRLSDWLTKEGRKLDFDSVHTFIDSVSSSSNTRKNYLWAGRDFWRWACKYQSTFREQFSEKSCPFDGHILPKTKNLTGGSYLPFTKQEIEDLHTKIKNSGNNNLANLVVFGVYTGARLEEIGRISVANTIFDKKGNPIAFSIEQAKTEAGVREVPIHSKLLPLYKELLTSAPMREGFLFKGGKNKYGNRLDYLSKQFGRFKTAEGFDNLRTFHSVRKTSITELHRAGTTMEVLPWIVGHESAKAFTLDVYSSGPSLEQKRKAIEKLKFNFN